MTQSKLVPLGDYMEQSDLRNSNSILGEDSVRGLSTAKGMTPTKANLAGVSLTSYKIVRPDEIAFVPDTSRRGDKMSLGKNNESEDLLVSSISCVIRVKDRSVLSPDFLYLLFCRPEFDRYTRFHSWGSAREAFTYEDMCRVEIPLPSLAEQQKVVNAWKALREIKDQNEAIAAPLMQVCQSYIQDLKHKYESAEIGQFIEEFDIRNMENESIPVLGINVTKDFMPTVASLDGTNLKNYKVIKKGQFVFSGMQTGRDVCIRTGMYKGDNIALVSPAYTTYMISNTKCLHPVYFDLMFKRKEMDRLGAFYSDASVRANLEWERFNEIKIPLPPLEVQQSIVNLYNCANEAKKIAEEADRMSREVCPALIQYVVKN